MARRTLTGWGRLCASAVALLWLAGVAHGAALDEQGDISLGVRTYTAARIGSQGTDITICNLQGGVDHCGGSNGGTPPAEMDPQVYKSFTFPVSPAGHLRQNRFFVEAELDHNLQRLLQEGFGPFALLNELPFQFKKFKYHLTYRGEYEGIYDYGPAEYRTAYQFYNQILVPPFSGNQPRIGQARQRLRNVASDRNRLFQAYLETQVGELLVRFGRQILSWGETDAFRLLDNINPLDSSFGGFLVPLDERRVPLDMLLLNYYLGEVGPFYEVFLEGYAAVDNAVGFEPGVPQGSPWALPNLGAPSAVVQTLRTHPTTTIKDTRGGFLLKFNASLPYIEETTFGLANYWTYLDTPAVQTFTSDRFPTAIDVPSNLPQSAANGFLALAIQSAPVVQITGGTATFALPTEWSRALMLSGQPIFRSELAYFHGEPRFTQAQLDPFVYATGSSGGGHTCGNGAITSDGLCTGNFTCKRFVTDPSTGKRTCVEKEATGPRTGDSWNFVLGIDNNQFIRWLNPNQSFFISTQFFYKHLNGAEPRTPIGRQPPGTFNGEVLPVPEYYIRPRILAPSAGAAQAVFVHNPIDQYLQTLLIATSYYSGQVSPSLTLFYDWSGSFVALPQLTFSRDPFRFSMSYSYLMAGTLKGASGVSLLRDRDNVLFQFEYVI